jgi:hypothetical protein
LTRLLINRFRRLMLAVAALVTLNAGIFVLVPEYPLGSGSQRFLTRDTLLSLDRYYQDRFRAIEENFAPESTAILAANWHHVEYYLPEYARLPFGIVSKWEQNEGNPQGNPREFVAKPTELGLQLDGRGQAVIVVFDPYLMAFSESPSSTHELSLTHGGGLEYYVLTGEQVFYCGARSFGVRENQHNKER